MTTKKKKKKTLTKADAYEQCRSALAHTEPDQRVEVAREVLDTLLTDYARLKLSEDDQTCRGCDNMAVYHFCYECAREEPDQLLDENVRLTLRRRDLWLRLRWIKRHLQSADPKVLAVLNLSNKEWREES